MALKANPKAAKARVRMAKRAKRDRWLRENKKRLLMIFVGFLLIVFLAVGTPWGPDYYYSRLQERKMNGPDAVAPGYIEGLYKLAVFYNFTLRESEATRCYDEIGKLYFGFTLSEYARNPGAAQDQQEMALTRIKKGLGNGPPFTIQDSEARYVGYSIWRLGEIMHKTQSRQFVYRIYNGLYMEDILDKYPIYCDATVTSTVKAYVDRFQGNR